MKRLPLFRSPEVGARTPVYVASSPEIEGLTGKYFVKCESAPSKPITHDLELAARLWDISASLTGLDGAVAYEPASLTRANSATQQQQVS
jgi:hypothetical protein